MADMNIGDTVDELAERKASRKLERVALVSFCVGALMMLVALHFTGAL